MEHPMEKTHLPAVAPARQGAQSQRGKLRGIVINQGLQLAIALVRVRQILPVQHRVEGLGAGETELPAARQR